MKILVISAHAEPDTPSLQLAFFQPFEKSFAYSRINGPYKIATEMRNLGHDVEVVDFIFYWSDKELERLFNDRIPHVDVVAWSSQFFYNHVFYRKWANYIKQINPKVELITGGPKVNNLLNFDRSKYLLAGYAENAIKDVLDHIEGTSKKLKFKLVNNQYYIDCPEFYPMTDDVGLVTEHHESDCIEKDETLTMGTTRGCIFNCTFCTYPLIGKGKNQFDRTVVESYYRELMTNYERWGTTNYYLPDETANDSIEKLRILEQAAERLPFKLDLTGFVRIDLLGKQRSHWELFKNIGFTNWHFGIETLNPTSLKILGKPYSPEKLKDIMLDMSEYFEDNICSYASFMIGCPEDSPELFEKYTLDWLRNEGKTALTGKIFFPLNILNENPFSIGSEFTRNYKSYGYHEMAHEDIVKEQQLDDQITDDVIKETKKYTVLWKNKHWNIMSAHRYSSYCEDQVRWHNNLSPWHRARGRSVGLSHKEIINLCNPVNKPFRKELDRRIDINLKQYIQNKLNKSWLNQNQLTS